MNNHNNEDKNKDTKAAETAKATDAQNTVTSGSTEEDTDKYLAMEQPGVSYTMDTDPTVNSDQIDAGSESRKKQWNEEGGNSKYSDAFNQDDYLLEDNLDLDEDQNQSISSDDDDFEETNERYTH